MSIEEVVSQVAHAVSERMGLDLIGLGPDDIRDIVDDIVRGIMESRSTKPTIESLVKRIVAGAQHLRKAIAYKLLEQRGEELTLEQIEFIIANAPEAAGRSAPILYRIASRYNAEHLISALQVLWSRYGKRTPIRCPRCGFEAVTPELVCMVCNAILDEREVKSAIGFTRKLELLARSAPIPIVREILQAGFVVLDDEVHAPSTAPRRGFRVEIYLDKTEKELVKRILRERGFPL